MPAYLEFFCKHGFHDGDDNHKEVGLAEKTREFFVQMLNEAFHDAGIDAKAFKEDAWSGHNPCRMIVRAGSDNSDIFSSSFPYMNMPHPAYETIRPLIDSVGAEWQRKYWDPKMRPRRKSRKNPA